MCNANVYKAGIAALRAADKKDNLKDLALGVGPVVVGGAVASKTDPKDRKFQDYATAYTQELRRAAIREVQLDLSHLKTTPTEAEYSKMIDEYSAFPDVKKQAFAKVFPEGITEKNQRLAAAVFEDAEPIPQVGANKYDALRHGKGKRDEKAYTHRVQMENSPVSKAALPQEMQEMEGDGGAWRYSLSNAAARAMVRDGIKYDPQGGETVTKVIESYMTRKDVQREAYRNTYDPTNRGQARAIDKAPRIITAAVFADTADAAVGASRKATIRAPEVTASSQPGSTGAAAAGLTPGTPEFEQEKQRRMDYWKQKAADQLRIETPQGASK